MKEMFFENYSFYAFIAGDKSTPENCRIEIVVPESIYADYFQGQLANKYLITSVLDGDEQRVREILYNKI